MAKAGVSLVAALLASILLAYVAYRASSPAAAKVPGNKPWASAQMEFVTWNSNAWTAWIRGGAFELIPQDTRNWHRHSNPSLAFIGWDGEPWQAKIDGQTFLLAHRGNWSGPTQRASAIRYRDWRGDKQLRTVSQLAR